MGKAVWKAMLKLVKYELRKNRTAILVLLAIAAALEAYFLISIAREASEDVYAAIALLTLLFACVSFAVFILGVSSYSGELKRRSSYLIFMTPNSALAVVISKLLFTLALAILFSALALALLAVDMPIFLDAYGEWEGYYVLFEQLLSQQGVALGEIISGFLLTVAQLFLQILSYVGVAYLSITLSATILQSRKGRGLVSFLLFMGIVFVLSHISGLYVTETLEMSATGFYVQALAPTILQSVLVLVASTILSALMLKRHVSL